MFFGGPTKLLLNGLRDNCHAAVVYGAEVTALYMSAHVKLYDGAVEFTTPPHRRIMSNCLNQFALRRSPLFVSFFSIGTLHLDAPQKNS